MEKKMGRPTDDPKIIVKRARMSESDVDMLRECCEVLRLSESDILRMGIKNIHDQIKAE